MPVAFGHGLSYTTFEYSELTVNGSELAFTLRNTGSRTGAEAAQLYVGPPPNFPVPMSPKALAGFERVELAPGRSQRVTIRIETRAFCYWSTDRQEWVVAPGNRPVYVGSSSRDIRLSGTIAPQR